MSFYFVIRYIYIKSSFVILERLHDALNKIVFSTGIATQQDRYV